MILLKLDPFENISHKSEYSNKRGISEQEKRLGIYCIALPFMSIEC